MRKACILLALAVAALSSADDRAAAGAFGPAQSAADVLREFAGADGAFLAAGLIRDNSSKDNLATLLQFRTDEVMVLNLSGSQIRQAFERSLSLFPQPNTSFLQISGFEVTFSRTAVPNSRVVSVMAGSARLEDGKTYRIAMPSTLARGAFGYFKVWDRSNIGRTIEGSTMEDVLKGKRATETTPRWIAQ